MKQNSNWYDLDNQATIYPAVSDSNNTNVFRISCTLYEIIDQEILQQAVDITMPSFQYYKMTLRRGLFWYYLDPIDLEPIVEPESKRPCSRLFSVEKKSLLFSITYFSQKINLEVFHALSDGGGAMEFFKAIIFNYLKISHKEDLAGKNPILPNRAVPESQLEDGFKRHYKPGGKKGKSASKAFLISGTSLPNDRIQVIGMQASTKEMLALAKSANATLTSYLTALIILALYKEYMGKRDMSKDVAITVPVDLRGMFPSPTLRNFFSVIDVRYNFEKDPEDFDAILQSVKKQLKEKINIEDFNNTLSYNVWAQENFASRVVPLFIKTRALKIIYKANESKSTTTFSNVGKTVMPPEMVPYIDNISSLLNPTKTHKTKMCISTFEDALVMSFTSTIAQTGFQKFFARFLSEKGINITITTNGGDDYETL